MSVASEWAAQMAEARDADAARALEEPPHLTIGNAVFRVWDEGGLAVSSAVTASPDEAIALKEWIIASFE